MKKILTLVLCASIFCSYSPVVRAEKAKSPADTVTILMAGDILLHSPVEDAAKDENDNYNFDFIFDDAKELIQGADVAIVNQEVIIGGKDLGVSGYPCFNAPYAIGDALVNAGFDVVCHSTNHSLDKGKSGIENCCAYWKEFHPEITMVGLNDSYDRFSEIDIIEKNGIRIAILNYTYGTNGISAPRTMPYAVDMLDKDKVISDLKYAEENADFTIVCPHWGTEYNLGIDKSQKKWAEIFRENGADLVIGAHPHVIEPVEMMLDDTPGISNNHGGGDMLVYYSIGNFVNWTSGTGKGVSNRMVGGLANIIIEKSDNGEVRVKSHGITPIICHLQKGYQGIHVYPLSDYTDELGKENEIRKQDSSFSRDYCVELCKQVWWPLLPDLQ